MTTITNPVKLPTLPLIDFEELVLAYLFANDEKADKAKVILGLAHLGIKFPESIKMVKR